MEFELPAGEDIAGLQTRLRLQFRELGAVHMIMAVNSEYVANSYKLQDGDTVAVIPPISGG